MIEVLSIEIEGGFNVVYAPEEVCKMALDNHRAISALYIIGNSSKVAGRVRRNLNVRRAFTVHQLIEILLEAYEEVVFIEHDPVLFEDCDFPTLEDLIMLLRQIGIDRTVFYFSCRRDRVFDLITKMADRYVYVEREENGYYLVDASSNGLRQLFCPKNAQLTLEAFSR
ncbi:MAG: hypothetical protein PWQ22_1558 [Archaeoglobaceae archaeon]|nr:hypothetical protein [Archaeoglobaceae archaeon]